MKSLALALLLAAPARATRPLTPPAPEFPDGIAWLNAKPLPLSVLRDRKAVVVAFLNPVGLDSLREEAALKAWFDRYALSGLMIVGVVTPSLNLERDVLWLKAELKRTGVEFPVVVDSDRKLWKAYQGEGWPALYLVDRKGRIVFDKLGEGGYGEFEGELRAALADVVGASSLPSPVDFPEPRSSDCGRTTPETPLGARAPKPARRLGAGSPRRDQIVTDARVGEIAYDGNWASGEDGLRLTRPNASLEDFVRASYQAAQVLAVLAPPAGRRARFFLKRDDEWLHEGDAGRDVRYDDDGRSYVEVAAPRLYDLVRDDASHPHQLFVLPESAGSGVHVFSYADSCLVTDLP